MKLDRNDQEKCFWAFTYLSKKVNQKIEPPYNGGLIDYFDACAGILKTYNDDKALRQMGDAWRGHTYRSRKKTNGRRARTLFLSDQSFKWLKKLAKDASTSPEETLEQLINDTYRHFRAERRLSGDTQGNLKELRK